MDSIKEEIKTSMESLAADARKTEIFGAEGALRISQAVANLTNAMLGIATIEDQEAHTANVKAQVVGMSRPN
jgi:hypothetical protein